MKKSLKERLRANMGIKSASNVVSLLLNLRSADESSSIIYVENFIYTKIKFVNMQKVISIRPTEEMERKLERLLGIEKMGRSAVIRKILDRGINEELKRYALELFKDKRVSLAKAAEIADISLRAMMDLIKEKDIPLHITIVDIRDDFEAAMR